MSVIWEVMPPGVKGSPMENLPKDREERPLDIVLDLVERVKTSN